MNALALPKLYSLFFFGLLSVATSVSAQHHDAVPTISQQCGVSMSPLVDAAAKHYLTALIALGGTHATWGDTLCNEARIAVADDGMHRLKAVLGAHLLHQATTRDTFSTEQKVAIGQAIDRIMVRSASRNKTLELIYVEVRSNAALENMSADGLADEFKEKSPAVTKTLGKFAERWEP